MKFKTPIEVQAGISDGDPTNPLGQAGYLLSSDGSNVNWVSPGGLSAETAEAIVQPIKANEALEKGDPVYIVGFNNGQNTNIVAKADSSDVAKMPVVGLVDDDYASQAFGTMTAFGSFNGAFDTTGGTENWAIGDIIFVKPGGGLTNVKPTGTDLIQNIAIVSRVNSQTGELEVIALGRTNDVPNLPEGRLFVGTAANTSLASDVVYVDDTNNRVGIRTAFPQVAFHVDGAIRVRGDLQVSQQNNNTFVGENMPDLTVITGNNNTALGDSVMPGATTASFNTGIGALSLNAFVNGNNNTAVGTDSMKLSNGASFNTSIGTGSLKAATVGQGNTAIGFSALAEKTTTNFNTAVGNNCLGNITTGFRNTAVGNDAGKFTADGITSNLTGNQSIFIGDSAKPLANAQNNQIVIGYDAIGNGANTATIGNNSIVKTILKGSVGVGTTLPNYKLEVMGTLGVNRTDGIIFAGSLAAGLGNKITSDTSNNFIFSTSLPSAPYTTIPKMTILNGGNVGIGTTNPSSILHLEDTTPTLKILSNQVYNNSVISMGNGQSEAVSITCNNNPGLSNLELKYDNGGLGDARIRVGQRNLDFMIDGGTAMYINSSKNVGIGTTGPGAYKLAVAGSTVIGGNVEVSDGLGGDQVLTLTPNTGSFKIGDIEGVGDEGYIEGNSSSIKIFTGGGETLVCDVNQRVGIGIAIPQSKLQVNGGVQLANDTASPSATKVGTFRYRTSGNNSYVDMCMQTGASTYAWVNIVTNSW